VVVFAVMFGRGTMGLGSIFVMFCRLIVCVSFTGMKSEDSNGAPHISHVRRKTRAYLKYIDAGVLYYTAALS
jgi:hypothetical protein